MSEELGRDKLGKPIHAGDQVWTRFRGGKREGVAQKADEKGRIIYEDQHGHEVAHYGETLEVSECSHRGAGAGAGEVEEPEEEAAEQQEQQEEQDEDEEQYEEEEEGAEEEEDDDDE